MKKKKTNYKTVMDLLGRKNKDQRRIFLNGLFGKLFSDGVFQSVG